MIIKCPEYGAENQTTQTPQPEKRYRCGKCGASITFTQTTDIPDIATKTLQEKPQSDEMASPAVGKRWYKSIILTGDYYYLPHSYDDTVTEIQVIW